jgi:hypothetical protein
MIMASAYKRKQGVAYDPTLINKVLKWGRKGFMPSEMAALAGVSTRTWTSWQDKYPAFAMAVQMANNQAESYLMTAARRRVDEGSDTLIKFLLSSKFGYAEKQDVAVTSETEVKITFGDLKAKLPKPDAT